MEVRFFVRCGLKRSADQPEDKSGRSEFEAAVDRRTAPSPPLCPRYSGATRKLQAGGDDCLTGANEGGNLLGKRLTTSEALKASAACCALASRSTRASHRFHIKRTALFMQISLTPVMCLLTALIVGATDAGATPLNPFRYEAQAQRHCPDDIVVWLDFRKGIYYSKQQKRYSRGSTGSFVCREEARDSGYRRSLLGFR
jgi:hypothetical protein